MVPPSVVRPLARSRAKVGAIVTMLALLVSTGVLASCAGSPTTQASPSTKGSGRTVGSTGVQPVQWQPCRRDGFDCASVEVPLDHADPTGRQIELALQRHAADRPEERIGTLFYNPGGPGASGIDSVPGLVGLLGDDVRDRFDIVGWDPRGVGRSTALHCDAAVAGLYGTDLDEQQPDPSVDAASHAVAEQCHADAPDLLPFLGTADVARDLDLLRAAVGDERLTYLGASYGTLIGLTYAELFPTHVRSMILDGVVDPTVDPLTANLQQSVAVDQVINRFLDWCRSTSCDLGADPAATLARAHERADRGELKGEVGGRIIELSPSHVTIGVVEATYDEGRWPTLARALRKAADGDGGTIADLADSYIGGTALGTSTAVSCLDSPRPTAAQLDDLLARAARQAPRVGLFNANTNWPCLYWPTDPKPLPTTVDVAGAPPIMVWGTTGDNATPYANAVHVAQLLPGARLVTLEANRHAAIGANDCVTKLQSAYLVDGRLPDDGTRC